MKKPKGKILAIGGAEYKDDGRDLPMIDANSEASPFEILKRFLPDTGSKQIIEIIPAASTVPDELGESYIAAFSKIGFKNVHVMEIKAREDAHNKENVDRIWKAHAVLFAGGSQLRLSTTLGASKVAEAILDKYYDDPDFIIGGTSAGAMALSKIMIIEGQTAEAMIKGDLKTSSGLGYIDHIILDTHFIKRGRFGRLTQAILINPNYYGVGLGEDTALLISKGTYMECMGSGMVMIIMDGAASRYTNVAEAAESEPLSIENLTVHILTKGDAFILDERKFVPKKYNKKVAG